MKKLLLFLLVLAGGVSTASADWYVAGQSAITNGGDWEVNAAANKMTLRADGKYQLVTNKSLSEDSQYEYKITDGQWGAGHEFGWNNSNAYFKTHAAGTYTITFVFDPASNNVYEAEALLTNYAEGEGIYLHGGNTWSDNDSYKFLPDGAGTFSLDIDVSSFTSNVFYYRFHYSKNDNDFGAFEGNVALNNGYFKNYEIDLAGNFWKNYNKDGKDHNFVLPLNTKPCAKLHLELQIKNKKVLMNMLCYEKATTNSSGFCTFRNFYPLNISDATAYYAVDQNNGSAKAYTITNPVANTPMLIKGDPSKTYYFAVAESGTALDYTNAFKAGTGEVVSAGVGPYNYILKGDQFYLANGTTNTVATNKAYLQLSQAATARVLLFDDEEEVTGITSVKSENSNVYFDLQGRRVAQPTKGLYIMNGKKFIKK